MSVDTIPAASIRRRSMTGRRLSIGQDTSRLSISDAISGAKGSRDPARHDSSSPTRDESVFFWSSDRANWEYPAGNASLNCNSFVSRGFVTSLYHRVYVRDRHQEASTLTLNLS